MKNIIRFLLGLNLASIVRGARLGFLEFYRSCFASLSIVYPFQARTKHLENQALQSIPKITLDEILGARKVTITLNVQKHEDGMLSAREAIALMSIVAVESPREVLEIGTFMGHTTRALADNLPAGIVHTVDLPLNFSEPETVAGQIPKDDFHLIKRRVVGREYKGQPAEARIKQHFGDSALIDFSEFGQPDFFFIDGAHTYEYCKQDSEKCFELCNGRGTFIWHDCDEWHPGVVKFVNEWRAAGRNLRRIEGTYMAYWKSPE